jgi:hypothetical protein
MHIQNWAWLYYFQGLQTAQIENPSNQGSSNRTKKITRQKTAG